jgi:hypothetical protein
MSSTRRLFLLAAAVGGTATAVRAQTRLDEKDPQALALGYVGDGARADAKKYPKFAPGQDCAGCALFQGKAGDAAGGCPLYAGKRVAAGAWCSAWIKKA